MKEPSNPPNPRQTWLMRGISMEIHGWLGLDEIDSPTLPMEIENFCKHELNVELNEEQTAKITTAMQSIMEVIRSVK